MKKIDCVFCGNNREKSKEHIWPKWLQKKIAGKTIGKFSGTHISMSSVRVMSQRMQSGESLVFGNVCKDCNNGWMSILENDFKDCFVKIKKDYSKMSNLTKKERNLISIWGLKTAMMINSGSNYRKIIPKHHFEHLNNHLQIPKNVKVDIAYINSNDKLRWQQSNFTMSSKKMSEYEKRDPYDLTKNSYSITMQIDRLGIKVLYYKDCKENGFTIKESNDSKAIRIWPFRKNGKFNISNNYEDIQNFHLDTFLFQ